MKSECGHYELANLNPDPHVDPFICTCCGMEREGVDTQDICPDCGGTTE